LREVRIEVMRACGPSHPQLVTVSTMARKAPNHDARNAHVTGRLGVRQAACAARASQSFSRKRSERNRRCDDGPMNVRSSRDVGVALRSLR
jgi:hypothetical protein